MGPRSDLPPPQGNQSPIEKAYRFQHVALRSGEIRLVTLAPQSARLLADDPIRCSVQTVDLAVASPSYECLSYVWGDSTAEHRIIQCNARPFAITIQLHSALLAMRSRSGGEPRVLWIDQLCINQNDVQEKTAQVQRMAEIFRNATQVLLFAADHSQAEVLLDFMQSMRDRFDEDEDFEHAWLNSSNRELENSHQVPSRGSPAWIAVRNLLGSECFRRLWIVQEVALAGRVRLILGGSECDIDSDSDHGIYYFVDMLLQRYGSNAIAELEPYTGAELRFFNAMLHIRELYRHDPNHKILELLRLLNWTRGYEVTDLRDKVYGLLSVAKDSQQLGILPDYSRSKRQCYIDVARNIVLGTGSLSLLAHVEIFRHDASLPSWVPDWTYKDIRMALYEDGIGYGSFGEMPIFSAGSTLLNQIQIDDQDRLHVEGIMIGTINSITSGPVDEHDPDPEGNLIGRNLWWLRAYSFIGPIHRPTGETLPVALGRTRVWGMQARDDELETDLHCDLLLELKDEIQANLHNLKARIHLQTMYQVLFTTSNEYMGLAPLTAQEGDQVFVLLQCRVPFVLRPIGSGEWRLVGKCYCHGIMDGEASDMLERIAITLI